MTKQVLIGEVLYDLTDEGTYSAEEEVVFEIRQRPQSANTFVVGLWDDFLGQPVRKVWRIVGSSAINSYIDINEG